MKDAAFSRSPTIYDVARAAGVAASTVSRAYSRPGRVNSETAHHIRQVAADLGYRANPIARALPTGRTSMIALVISDVTNPFHGEIIRGAQDTAADAGYTMLLSDAQESGAREREALDRALSSVDGVVLADTRMSDASIRSIAKQKPVVVLNRALADVPCVVTDNARGMRRALEHVAQLGHECISYLAGPDAAWSDGIRWRALREGAPRLGLQARRLGPFAPTVRGGAAAANEFMRCPTSAVIAYNDLIAIGFIRTLTELGASIPQDVSVIGFDNIYAGQLLTPMLTSVAAPLSAMGSTATGNLLAIIRGAQHRSDEPVSLPSRLVIRDSTAPVDARPRDVIRVTRSAIPGNPLPTALCDDATGDDMCAQIEGSP
jgi:DNA-binding LacI/PurR family transcriptional regulator